MKKLFLLLAFAGIVGATSSNMIAASFGTKATVVNHDDKKDKKKDCCKKGDKKACAKDANGKACAKDEKSCSKGEKKACCKNKSAEAAPAKTEEKKAE
ncbi:MAG: hypothetical protein J0M08_07565 [Bacteroidetes bacterium]|nr:hypothetical protein [Bacteroidota bacterium]